MVSIDQRTRTDAEREPLDLEDFFDVQLPELAAEHSHLAVPGALELGVEPFTFDTPAGSLDDVARRRARARRPAGRTARPSSAWTRASSPTSCTTCAPR